MLDEIRSWRGLFGPNFRRVFRYLRPHRRILAVIGLLSLLYIPLSLVEPYLLYYLVDRILLAGQPERLLPFAIRILPFFVIATAVDFLLTYSLLKLARDLHYGVKSAQLDNLLAKSANFFRGTAAGRVLFSFFNDSNQIGALLSFGIINTALNVFFILARLAILWYVDAVLMAAYLCILPFQSTILYRVMKTAMRLEIRLKSTDEELTARVESLLRGALTVKAFGFGPPLASIWKRLFASRLDVDFLNMMWKQLGGLGIVNIQAVGVFLVLFLGVYQIEAGRLSLGAVLAFIAIAGRITPSLQTVMGFFVGLQETMVNIERYYRIYDLPDESAEFSGSRLVPAGAGGRELSADRLHEIRVRDVLVDHGNGGAVRIPCDFAMRAGESYLWYGPNGAGKTSLGLALAGLIPHARGSILCDGEPLGDFAPASIRRQILYVGGEPFWPERTLEENFLNSENGAVLDPERLRLALSASTADEVLASLPLGMRTTLSSDGHILSRGENQRLFLALVLYRQPRVLILDESLSNVSVPRRREILERLRAFAPESVIVHVSHRRDHAELFDHEVPFAALG
jgi:ATP-binding cassette subfamily B protein